jgi:hypothetical protein
VAVGAVVAGIAAGEHCELRRLLEVRTEVESGWGIGAEAVGSRAEG